MPPMSDMGERPLIWIGFADYVRLLKAMEEPEAWRPDVSAFLRRELDRAIVRRDGELPRAVVRMGTRVLFRRDDGAAAEWGTLAFPEDADGDEAVSIASPLGAALLGLRHGASITYPDGAATRRLSVERVLCD